MKKFFALLMALCVSGISGWLIAFDYPPPDLSLVSAEMYIVLGIFSVVMCLIVAIA